MTDVERETSTSTVGPGGSDTPVEPPAEERPETTPHSWRRLVLVLAAAVVLVAGLAVATAGMLAKADAEDSATAATASLVTATADRDTALAQVAHANEAAAGERPS